MERVRESAAEAGISEQHVERAAAELGLARGAGRRSALSDAPRAPLARYKVLTPLFAAPFRLQEETEIEGAVSPGDYEVIVDTIRGIMGDEGSVSSLGRSLTWSSRLTSRKGRNVNVTIFPRAGRTRIRIDERLGQLAGGLYGGLVGGTASLGVLACVSAFNATHSVVAGIGAGLLVELTTFSIARTIIGKIKRTRQRQIANLRGQLEAEVRESIAAGSADHR